MLKATAQGFLRVIASPGLVLWLWLVSIAVALPATWAMTESLRSSLGASLVADELTKGFDAGWYGEFENRAKGMEKTFKPTVVGPGAFYNNLEAWLTGDLFRGFPGLVGLGIVYALLWALFLGGILDRYSGAKGRFGLSGFLSTGGGYFFRFVRLAVLSGVLYYGIYRLSKWLYGGIDRFTIDVTVETTVFAYTLVAVAFVVVLMTLVNVAFDYAKIATFREGRRSMLLAALRGFRLVLSHPVKTMGLYYSLGAVGIVVLGLYASIAPGANQSSPTAVVAAFLIGQAYLVVKLVLRLWFYGAQMALYEGVTGAARPAGSKAELG